MKICYINPTFLVRRPIADLIDRLSKDNKVGIFMPKKPFKKLEVKWHSDSALKKAKFYSYSAISLPGNFEWPIPVTPMFLINLFRVFWNYEVVHMWTYFYINSIFTLFFSLFFPKRKLIMSCDTFPAYSFKSGKLIDMLFKIYCNLFGWFIFSIPNKIHLYGKSMVEFAKKAGVRSKKIVVIPTGIDLQKFKQGRDIRKELGLDEKDFVVIYAGLIVPRKGIDIMLKAIKGKNVKLLLVGDGPSKKEYVQMAEKLGVNERVKFLGWRKDIPDLLKSSNVLFLPSRGEGLPGIVMEAMASGLPIVASNIPCIPDLVEDGKNGWLCEMNDVDCFAKKLMEINKGRRSDSLRKIKEFDWNLIIKKYIEMYK